MHFQGVFLGKEGDTPYLCIGRDIEMNYYEILEVSEKSSTEVIAGAYKALTKKYHPDISKDVQAIEKMKAINLAYEVLSNPQKRAEYDRSLHLNRNTTATDGDRRNNTQNEDKKRTAQREERERAKRDAEEQARNEARVRYYKQEAERKAAEIKEKEAKRKANIQRLVLSAIVVLLVLFYYTNHQTESANVRSRSFFDTTASAEKEAESYVEKAKNSISNHDYYEAMKAIDSCRKKYPNSTAASECGTLVSQIEKALKNKEPKNGTTLERTFQYMGGCALRVTAKSGPVVVTISDKSNPNAYASIYVRKGQTADVTVTGGTYRVNYKIGSVWFNDRIGFGDLYEAGSFKDDFVFKVETTVGWVSSSVWEITI